MNHILIFCKNFFSISFFKKPKAWQYWIMLALLVKGGFFYFDLSQNRYSEIESFWGSTGGDTNSYLMPIDNLLQSGRYDPDYRMPGYGIIYFLLGTIFNKAIACNIIIILQYIMGGISVYLLALTARSMFQSDTMYYLTYFSFLISTYTSLFYSVLLTESFCVSACIFYIFFLEQYLKSQMSKYLVWSGVFFSWMVFLRPVYLPLILLPWLMIFYLYITQKSGVKLLVKALFLFSLPFILSDGVWIVRNAFLHNRFIPLQASLLYPGTYESYRFELNRFLQSWGGSFIYWNPNAEIRWFGIGEHQVSGKKPLNDQNIIIPEYIYTTRFGHKDLLEVKELIRKVKDEHRLDSERQQYSNMISERLRTYTESIRQETPFLYYIYARLILLKKFLIHSGTYNLFAKASHELNIIEFGIKVFYSLFYLLIVGCGIVGIGFLLIPLCTNSRFLVAAVAVYPLIIFPIVLRFSEMRYFVPSYPFMLICSMYVISQLCSKLGVYSDRCISETL